MLSRYKIYRGKSPAGVELPAGIRQDTRKHTRHCLRPRKESVDKYLADPTEQAWEEFSAEYRATIEKRWQSDPGPFDDLAVIAVNEDVHLGCSCPTAKNPNVQHCHTVLALEFMRQHYPALRVEFP